MPKDRSHAHRIDGNTPRSLSQPGQLEKDIESTLPNDALVQSTITKVSELDALTVRHVQSRLFNPPLWIGLLVINLIATLYLFF